MTHPRLSLVFSITVSGVVATSVVSPLIPAIINEFGVPSSTAGLIVSAATIPGVLSAPAAGWLSDRFGRRVVTVVILLVASIAGGASALSPTLEWLLGLRFIQGAASAGLINMGIVLIVDHWTGAERSKKIGQNAAVITTSIAVIPLVSGLVASFFDWRVSVAGYLLGVPLALLAARLLPDEVRGGERQPSGSLVNALLDRYVATTLLASVAAFAIVFGLKFAALPLLVAERFSWTPGAIGALLMVPALTSTTSALKLAGIHRRFGIVGSLALGFGGYALGAIGFFLAPTQWALIGAALIFGLGDGVALPSVQSMAAEGSPVEVRGTVIALAIGATRLGQAIGPLGAGLLIAWHGVSAIYPIGALVAVSMATLTYLGYRLRWLVPSADS